MAGPQGPPLTARLGARIGPEVVASILVIAVAFVAIAVASSGSRGGPVEPSPPASEAAVVPSVTVLPSATPLATGTPPASATPLATPPPPSITPRPANTAAALAVRDIIDRLIGQRADLEEEIARTPTNSGAIADLLRDVNASIVQMDDPLADLGSDPATADLASRIREMNSATSATVSRIQHTSPRNAKTYRDGAVDVVEDLEPLPGLRAELSALID